MNGIWQHIKSDNSALMAFVELSTNNGFTEEQAGKFRAKQVSAIKTNTPNMMVANIIAAIFMVWISIDTPDQVGISVWAATLSACSLLMLITTLRDKRTIPSYVRRKVIHKAENYALLMGIIWSILPAAFLHSSNSDTRVLMMGVVMGASGLGALNLSRVPSAAILYAALMTSSLAVACSGLEGKAGPASAGFGAVYGIALTLMIIVSHRAAIRRTIDNENMENQGEIIKLLLRDFEAGARDWLWETDNQSRLVYTSDRLASILRRSQERLLGAKLHQAANMNPDDAGWDKFAKLVTKQAVIDELELPVIIAGEERWWQISARPLYDIRSNFKGYRGVGRDITERHRSAAELIKAKEEAERASEAKTQFLAIMSHELRTPLNSILGFSDLILSHDESRTDKASLTEYARSVKESGQHLSNLLSGILDITRIEKGNMTLVDQEIDPAEIAEVVARMCRSSSRDRNVSIMDEIQTQPLEVVGDLTRIQQILINLVSNAVKFTADGGMVNLSLSDDDNGGIVYTITDNGIGIDEHQLKRIFEPFVQVDEGSARQFNGVGLGLAIARHLARMHGGDIVIESQLGVGTTVRFTLPKERVRRLSQTNEKIFA